MNLVRSWAAARALPAACLARSRALSGGCRRLPGRTRVACAGGSALTDLVRQYHREISRGSSRTASPGTPAPGGADCGPFIGNSRSMSTGRLHRSCRSDKSKFGLNHKTGPLAPHNGRRHQRRRELSPQNFAAPPVALRQVAHQRGHVLPDLQHYNRTRFASLSPLSGRVKTVISRYSQQCAYDCNIVICLPTVERSRLIIAHS